MFKKRGINMEKKQYIGCLLGVAAAGGLSLILLILKLMGIPLRWIVIAAPLVGSIISAVAQLIMFRNELKR